MAKNTGAVEPQSSEKRQLDLGPFHCSAERHLYGMASGLAPILYVWASRLSCNSGNFFPSVMSIAEHFVANRATVFRALQELERSGWLEALQREPGKTVNYRVVLHEEWQRQHPGFCIEKETFPWTGEGDPLAPSLYAASGGQAKFLPNQVGALRECGLSDEEIVNEFRVFLDRKPQKGLAWKSVYYRFRPHLFRVAASLGDAAKTKTPSDPLHARDPH
jgi:hypothetical protein